VNYFRLYQELSVLFVLFFSAGLVFLAFVIYFSVRNYGKPGTGGKPGAGGGDGPADEHGEHAEPGIPLVLKLVYLGVAVYIVAATVFVALSGMSIG